MCTNRVLACSAFVPLQSHPQLAMRQHPDFDNLEIQIIALTRAQYQDGVADRFRVRLRSRGRLRFLRQRAWSVGSRILLRSGVTRDILLVCFDL